MTKISFLALNRLLVTLGHSYVLEKSQEFVNKTIFNFVVARNYPISGPMVDMADGDDMKRAVQDRIKHEANIILQYSVEDCGIVSSNKKLHDIILEAKRRAIKAAVDKLDSETIPLKPL